MTPRSNNLLKSYLGALHYRPAPGLPALPQPFITMSRETGAGGTSIGVRVRDRLRVEDSCAMTPWMWFDRELMQKVVERHNLPQELAGLFDHTQYNRLLKWVDDLLGKHPAWSTVARKTGETILHLAQIGNVILVGRGAHLVARRVPHGLHVRIIGSRERRLAHAAEYYHLTRREADIYVTRNDRGRRQFLKDHLNADIDDAHQYDMVLNTDHISYEDAADLIVNQVKRIRARIREASIGGGG
jgi:cytidylate kinase